MPDLLAGTTILAQDITEEQFDDQGTSETGFTDTTYVAGANTCGTTFVAPTTGNVRIMWHARFESNTAGERVTVSMEVREGGTIGSGTVVSAATDGASLESEARLAAGMWRDIFGLTPGSTYNCRTMHRITGGNGDIFVRTIAVTPLT